MIKKSLVYEKIYRMHENMIDNPDSGYKIFMTPNGLALMSHDNFEITYFVRGKLYFEPLILDLNLVKIKIWDAYSE